MAATPDAGFPQDISLDHYTIERELGRGGMATVYLAHDVRHDRRVALKVFRPDVGALLGAERFTREVKLAAKLQHPHIVSVYDSGRTPDGTLWFTMPYVEGESLRQRLERERQLSLDDALRITREIADALAYAHSHGVIHRDIKPENILLADGHALLADFGVARAATTAGGGQPLTETGMALGTPTYMSPEQAAGDRTLDARTDVYALGCVLYEMLAGEPPYTGPTAQAVAAKMMAGELPSIRRTRSTVPVTVETEIHKALCPVPADRYASAGEFARALEAAVTGEQRTKAATPQRVPSGLALLGLGVLIGAGLLFAWRSRERTKASPDAQIGLAVLPFENVGDTADANFADGVTDAVRGKLASLPQLLVIASTSSGQYRKTTKSPQQIGRELGVRYLVVGRVRWARSGVNGDRVQVSPELIDATTASDKWQDAFDAPLTDVFHVQADIATRVAEALQIALTPAAQQTLKQAPTTNLDAYDAYIQAEALLTIVDEKQAREMIALYRRAITLDSNFGLAYAGLGSALDILYSVSSQPDSSQLLEAKAAIDHAVRLAPAAPEVVLALGGYYEGMGDPARALEQYRAAYRLNPNFARALYWAGDIEAYTGKWKEALQDYTRAAALNPGDWTYHSRAGVAYKALRQYAAAEREFDQVLALAPQEASGYRDKAYLLIWARGDTAGGRRMYDTALVRCGSERLARVIAGDWFSGLRIPDAMASVPLSVFGGDTTRYYLLKALYYRTRGVPARARTFADSARIRLERAVKRDRVFADSHERLALVYDYLGRTRDAVREIDAAATAQTERPGASDGVRYTKDYVRARSGDVSEALADLQIQVDGPSSVVSRARLRVDPDWDFLRRDPRFQQIIADSTATAP